MLTVLRYSVLRLDLVFGAVLLFVVQLGRALYIYKYSSILTHSLFMQLFTN